MDQSQIDLKQDFEELNWLAQSFGINHYTKNVNLTVQNKHYLKQKLRSHIALVAARRVGERWQSPSYNHTVLSQAGDQVNKIKGNITDYTRDQLIDGNTLQKQFSRVFLDTWRGLPVIPYFTSSGMAALTTILVFLLREKKINRPVLLGTNSYFQNAEVITRVLPVQVIKVEEPDLPSQISKTNPSAVFVDSLSNTHNLVRADLVQIIKSLKNFKTENYLVLDNTVLGPAFNPLNSLKSFDRHTKLLVFESFNKYYQYGLDRTIGGLCWGLPMDAGGLFDARMHSGTIMPDVCLSMLPPFNRTRLFNRLNRLNRNANLLAQLIQKQIQNNPKSKIASVNRPRSSGFNGPLITLNFNDRFDIPKHYQQFLKHILALARKQKLYLAAGTSFGFDITRVYVPALHTSHVKPFFRIAVGTETIDEIHLLGRILIEALAV